MKRRNALQTQNRKGSFKLRLINGAASNARVPASLSMVQRALAAHRGAFTALTCLALAAGEVGAQAFPSKPIRIVVGFAAGSGTDVVARIAAQRLPEALGQPVVIDNRPGSGGMIATEVVAKAAPDGYTLLMMAAADTIQPAMRLKMPYELTRDFTPITYIGAGLFILSTHPSVPARSVKELIALARASPGRLNYATTGIGSSAHMAGELFNSLAKVKTTAVPYKGGTQVAVAVSSGEVDFGYFSYTAAKPLLEGGRVRPLAVTSLKRSPLMPDTPSLHEVGLTGYDRFVWYGVIAPAGLPKEIVARLDAVIVKAVNTLESKSAFLDQGLVVETTTPQQFADLIRREVEQNIRLATLAGFRKE
jgi:tripartite-type tricarboxylate transporter receptor subunit TctC